MNESIIHVRHAGEFKLELTFKNGFVGLFDAAPYLQNGGPVFEPLKDVNYFKQVFVDPDSDTIAWPNGADFCPDVLRGKCAPLTEHATALF